MKFIDEARFFWRMYSTHAYMLTMAVLGGFAWLAKVHPEYYARVPSWMLGVVAVFLAFTYGISRCVKQVSVSGGDNAAS
jgi:FtsH-binding integral membrane protein